LTRSGFFTAAIFSASILIITIYRSVGNNTRVFVAFINGTQVVIISFSPREGATILRTAGINSTRIIVITDNFGSFTAVIRIA
jgi:uncharacterized membrane protein